MIYTGLKDDYGTPIKPGDTIEWTYVEHGVMLENEQGDSYFLPCVGWDLIERKTTEIKKIEYEVREDSAGYFLDRPGGIGMTFIEEGSKCKVKV